MPLNYSQSPVGFTPSPACGGRLGWGQATAINQASNPSPALTHSASITSANVHDSQELPNLLHGNETRLYGDSAYIGQKEVLKQIAPKARDFTSKRASRNTPLTDADKDVNGE